MTITGPTWTDLTLSGIGVVPYSTRQATQSLELADGAAAGIYTDVNGILRATGSTSFRKYKSSIQCTDQRPLAADGLWPGLVITVGCIVELAYKTAGGSPARAVVSGSSFADSDGEYTFYRPELEMMVMDFSISKDEYGAEVGWKLDLVEVAAS